MRARPWCIATAGVVASLPSLAHASPTSRLVYSRDVDAISCPDELALRSAVAARVGYDAFFPWAKRTVIATMARSGDQGFAATVDLIDEDGVRHGGHQLRTDGACAELLDPVALAVAIAIDPRLLAGAPSGTASIGTVTPPPAPPDAEAWPTEPVLAGVSPAPVASPGPDDQRVTLEATAGVAAAVGLAPAPSVGGTLAVGLRWARYSLGLEGFVAPPIAAHAQNGATGTVQSWPAIASVVPCVEVWRLFGCGVAQLGELHASATGVPSSTATWGALGGRVGVRWPLTPRVSLRGRLDVVGDLSPPTLVVEGASQPAAPPVAGSVGIDVVVRFP